MSKNLTPKQQEAIDVFRKHKQLTGSYPTFVEAGKTLGIAPAVVYSRIMLAEKKGVKLPRYTLKKSK